LKVWDHSSDIDEFTYEAALKKPDDGQRYDFLFTPWSELLGLEVSKKSIDKYGVVVVAAEIVRSMTLFELTEDEHREQVKKTEKKLKASLKSFEKEIKNEKLRDAEEVFAELEAELGIDRKEESEEEKLRNKERQADIRNKNEIIYEEFGFLTPYRQL